MNNKPHGSHTGKVIILGTILGTMENLMIVNGFKAAKTGSVFGKRFLMTLQNV